MPKAKFMEIWGGVGGRGGGGGRLWSLQKSDRSLQKSAKTFQTPCTLRAGGGGFKGYRLMPPTR